MAISGALSDWRTGTNGATTTLTDFTAKTRNVSANFEAETVESTTFGDTSRDYEMSFKNATIETTYKYDATLYGQKTAIYSNGDTVNFQLSPDGTASGKPKITGSCFITSVGIPVSVGELLELSVSWQVSGAVVFGTHT